MQNFIERAFYHCLISSCPTKEGQKKTLIIAMEQRIEMPATNKACI